MSHSQTSEDTQVSFLDRFTDDVRAHAIKYSIARDLEDLLNAKQALSEDEVAFYKGILTSQALSEDDDASYKGILTSILMYGLPDLSHFSLSNDGHRAVVCEYVEDSIVRFEPRLRSVRVTAEKQKQFYQTLNFRIEAIVQCNGTAEPVTFNGAVQLPMGRSIVKVMA